MRLLHVTDTFLPKIGGAEIAIDQLVRALAAAGVECAVLAQRVRGSGGEIQTPYPLFRFGASRSAMWAGWWIGRHIARVCRQVGPFDAIIGHHAFPPGYATVRWAERLRIPSIVYPRGGDIYEGSRFRKKPLAWRKLCWTLAHASAVVCASQAMEAVVGQIAPRPVVRIGNGVNIEELQADASASRFAADGNLAGPFVLGLGRTIRRKGFDLLIEAAGSGQWDARWKLVIAGTGRELESLQAQARPLGTRVVFTGLVEGADKRWLLQHCGFLAAPSREESFGNVALEAMACGKPVIASQASGFAEIVSPGENGLLTKVEDVGALAGAISQYQAASLDLLGEAALRTARQFSWKVIAQRYCDLVKELRLKDLKRS
jgi:glycosyltransferase involved in cell wall biosynthesis